MSSNARRYGRVRFRVVVTAIGIRLNDATSEAERTMLTIQIMVPTSGRRSTSVRRRGNVVTPLTPPFQTTYATANPTCAAIIIKYMWRQEG